MPVATVPGCGIARLGAMVSPAPSSSTPARPVCGRKTVPKKLLADSPVVLHAYDLLE